MMNFGWHGPAPNATRIVSVVVSRMFEETCVWHTTNSLEVVCEHEFREHTQYVAQKVHHWRRRDSYHDATLFAALASYSIYLFIYSFFFFSFMGVVRPIGQPPGVRPIGHPKVGGTNGGVVVTFVRLTTLGTMSPGTLLGRVRW